MAYWHPLTDCATISCEGRYVLGCGNFQTQLHKCIMADRRKLSHKEKRFIQYCEWYFHFNNHKFPTKEEAQAHLKYDMPEIQAFLAKPAVQAALTMRGLPWQGQGLEGTLDYEQMAAALTVTNFADTRPDKTKLEEIGISPTAYQAWLKNPAFKAFVDKQTEHNRQNIRSSAINNLAKHVHNGNFNAIKYYLESTGEFQRESVEDLQYMIQRLIDIIQRHVKDPETLRAIAEEIRDASPNTIVQTPKAAIEATAFSSDSDTVLPKHFFTTSSTASTANADGELE